MKRILIVLLLLNIISAGFCSKERSMSIASRATEIRNYMITNSEAIKLPEAIESSLSNQLLYVIEIEEGKRKDLQRMNDLTIGILTVREVEDRDLELANMLYELDTMLRKKYGLP